MHIIKVIFSLALILNICVSCHENDDTAYFNGKIQTIEDSIKHEESYIENTSIGWSEFWMAIHIRLTDVFYES